MGLKCGIRLGKGMKCGQCPSDHEKFPLSVPVDPKSSLEAGESLKDLFGNFSDCLEGLLHFSSGVIKCLVCLSLVPFFLSVVSMPR